MSNSLQRTPDAPEDRGWKISDTLPSGNHAGIERWCREQALERARQRRPDLLRAGYQSGAWPRLP